MQFHFEVWSVPIWYLSICVLNFPSRSEEPVQSDRPLHDRTQTTEDDKWQNPLSGKCSVTVLQKTTEHSKILVEKEQGLKRKQFWDSIYILKVNIKGYSSELLHIASFISLDISFRCWESTHYCWPRWKDLIGIWESLCFSYIRYFTSKIIWRGPHPK